ATPELVGIGGSCRDNDVCYIRHASWLEEIGQRNQDALYTREFSWKLPCTQADFEKPIILIVSKEFFPGTSSGNDREIVNLKIEQSYIAGPYLKKITEGKEEYVDEKKYGMFDLSFTIIEPGNYKFEIIDGLLQRQSSEIFEVNLEKEEDKCKVYDVKAGFQTVQRVFQDEVLPESVLAEYPQAAEKWNNLEKSKSAENVYTGKIDMVKGLNTWIFGLHTSLGREPNSENRKTVVIKGKTNCTEYVPVKAVFSVNQAGSKEIVYEISQESGVFSSGNIVPLKGKPGPEKEFTLELLPYSSFSMSDRPFTFKNVGEYRVDLEILPSTPDADAEENSKRIKSSFFGKVIETKGLNLCISPAFIEPFGDDGAIQKKLTQAVRDFEFDADPSVNASFPVKDWPKIKTNNFVYDLTKEWSNSNGFFTSSVSAYSNFKNALNETYEATVKLSGSCDRMIFILSDEQVEKIMPSKGTAKTYGMAVGSKIIILRATPDFKIEAGNLKHELIHTLPYLWSSDKIEEECGFNYHNGDFKIANGITYTGVLLEYKNFSDFMGVGSLFSQCTYKHLLGVLQNPPDPKVIMVRGNISKNSQEGKLLPFYKFDSTFDLNGSEKGDWAIVLKDSKKNEIGRYNFSPVWQVHSETDEELSELSFNYRIPDNSEIAYVELHGSKGLLDTKTLSQTKPVLYVNPEVTKKENGNAFVKWTADDKDGDELMYSVLYSTDYGNTLNAVLFEEKNVNSS
ncbi:MAG: hypothetical protein Q7K42_05330, partial [Candidatus Diapherotrites archaeon]|nr:hypothetical protein [Candidatus Diapherotrites archaeon]